MTTVVASAISTQAQSHASQSDSPAIAAARDAYIFGLPRIVTETIKNLEVADDPSRMNTFLHARNFPDPNSKLVARMNTDTLYSNAWLDLTQQAFDIHMPAVKGRLAFITFFDSWGNVISTVNTEAGIAKDLQVAGPGTEARQGLIQSPTNLVWCMIRIETHGERDIENVANIQDQFAISRAADGVRMRALSFDPTRMPASSAAANVSEMSGEEFFKMLAKLIKSDAPIQKDERFLAKLKSAGLDLNDYKGFTDLAPEMQRAVALSPKAALEKLLQSFIDERRAIRGWLNVSRARHVGAYGSDYEARARMTVAGLAANLPTHIEYSSAINDAEGAPLIGGVDYVMHFAPKQMPPARFWSLSFYSFDGSVVSNPQHRPAIHSFDHLVFEKDGSLILRFGPHPPRTGQVNWINLPKGDRVDAAFRQFRDGHSSVNRSFILPPIVKAPPPPPRAIEILNVNDDEVRWSKDGRMAEVLTYRRGQPASIRMPNLAQGKRCTVNGRPCRNGELIPLLPKTENDGTVGPSEVDVNFSDDKQKAIRIFSLPRNFPSYKISGKSATGAPLILAPRGWDKAAEICHLLQIAATGELEYFSQLPKACRDFRPHQIGNKRFYSYLEITSESLNETELGSRVILNDQFEFVKRIEGTFRPFEFLLLGLDHFVAVEPIVAKADSGQTYLDNRVREYDHGVRIFDWGTSEYLASLKFSQVLRAYVSSFAGHKVAELVPISFVREGFKGRWFIGLTANGIAEVDRKTGHLRRMLGGLTDDFALRSDQKPGFTHMADFDSASGKLTVAFDRTPNLPMEKSSFISQYTFDSGEKNGVAVKDLRDGFEKNFNRGSIQLGINQVVSVGFGQSSIDGPNLIELQEGREIFSFRLADSNLLTDRIYRTAYGEPLSDSLKEAKP